jgi:hypothetical protein
MTFGYDPCYSESVIDYWIDGLPHGSPSVMDPPVRVTTPMFSNFLILSSRILLIDCKRSPDIFVKKLDGQPAELTKRSFIMK